MNISKLFKNINLFSYRAIYKTLQNEKRNASNTNWELLDMIETFEMTIEDGEIYIGEHEIKSDSCILWDYKSKSYIIEDEDFYYKINDLIKSFEDLKEYDI